MKISNLDHLENFIQHEVMDFLKSHPDYAFNEKDSIVTHSLISHYVNHPFMENIYVGASLTRYEDQIFVRMLSYHDIQEYSLTNLKEVYDLNENLLENEYQIYNFDSFYEKVKSDSFMNHKIEAFPLQKVLKHFSNIDIPISSYITVSQVNQKSDSWSSSKEYLCQKINAYSFVESLEAWNFNKIKEDFLGNHLINQLQKDSYYKQFFNKDSLFEKRNTFEINISKIDRDFFKRFIHVPEHANSYKSAILNKLMDSRILKEDYGLVYCGDNNNDQCTGIYATNEFGELVGLLVIGKKMSYSSSDELNKHARWIKSIAVHKSFRGLGVSDHLFQQSIKFAEKEKLILFITPYSDEGEIHLKKKFDKILKSQKIHYVIQDDQKEKAFPIVQQIYESPKYKDMNTDSKWKQFQLEFTKPNPKMKVKP
jgi:ribosomal protein S18 acetylase RimI-like enzyme